MEVNLDSKIKIRNFFQENEDKIKGNSFLIETGQGSNPRIEVTGIGDKAIKYNYSHPSKYKFNKNGKFTSYEDFEKYLEDKDSFWYKFIQSVQKELSK